MSVLRRPLGSSQAWLGPWLAWLSRPGAADLRSSGSHCVTRATRRARAIASSAMEHGCSVRRPKRCEPNKAEQG